MANSAVEVNEPALLHCPIRGQLKVAQRAKDGLTFTEEKCRIDALRFLLQRGYPKENFGIETVLWKFGNKGRNSFRTDFVVYDEPFEDVKDLPLEERRGHIRLVAEIKRDSSNLDESIATQVRPALNFVSDLSTIGLYWDDIEQRFFYRTVKGSKTETHEAPISKLPEWGRNVSYTPLCYQDLDATKEISRVFDQIEVALHPHVADKAKRYVVLVQLLILKIDDENRHKKKATSALDLQDFTAEAVADSVVLKRMNAALETALAHYQQYLPEKIPAKFNIPVEALRRASQLLAPLNILQSRKEVIQNFYMKFAQNLYKWDLAQYFTPHEVIDFIVDVINPGYGEHVKDPACGSADFLVSAYRAGSTVAADYGQCIWGSDNSEQACQISILNMLLNGDGKTNIKQEDSLEAYSAKSRQFNIVLCNPPFGTKILEKRWELLKKFDMGHKWIEGKGGYPESSDGVLDRQQTGILFAELCVKISNSNGRVGIILPNGYLGNKSLQYRALREWLLRHTKIVGVVGFPRFTFKKSGADVSASVLFLEKREKPLASSSQAKKYNFFVGMVDSVGWSAGDKKAEPIFRRDPETGTVILDEDNEPVLDSDFAQILDEFLRSGASNCFPWLLKDRKIPAGPQACSVKIEDVVGTPDLVLDPKRLCEKFRALRNQIMAGDHFRLGDVLESVPSEPFKKKASAIYKYIEIDNIGIGDYDYQELRGWQLADRAKLPAKKGDIFIAAIWSSVGKWFINSADDTNMVVTNGCARLRFKPGKEKTHLIDVIVGLCTEAFRVQMRGFATGSDGLAEITNDDLLNVVLPRVKGKKERERLQSLADVFLTSDMSFGKAVTKTVSQMDGWPNPPQRKKHWVLV